MTKPKQAAPKPVSSLVKGRDEFRAAHDKSFIIPNRIREGIKKLNPAGCADEIDFLKLAGLSTTDLARFRHLFEENIVNVGTERQPKRVWAGSKKFADELREMV
jgi:hypothetical protein